MSRLIYLARHGETEWNALAKLQGATDVPLNDTGRAQARALGERIASEGVDSVTTSDLSRARETGAIAAQSVKPVGIAADALIVDADLRERSFGIFEGLTRVECETHHAEAWQDWQVRAVAPPNAEPTEQVVLRMTRGIARIFAANPGRGVTLLVSHGGAMRLFMNSLTGDTYPPIGNGAIYVIGADLTDGKWSVTPWDGN